MIDIVMTTVGIFSTIILLILVIKRSFNAIKRAADAKAQDVALFIISVTILICSIVLVFDKFKFAFTISIA